MERTASNTMPSLHCSLTTFMQSKQQPEMQKKWTAGIKTAIRCRKIILSVEQKFMVMVCLYLLVFWFVSLSKTLLQFETKFYNLKWICNLKWDSYGRQNQLFSNLCVNCCLFCNWINCAIGTGQALLVK